MIPEILISHLRPITEEEVILLTYKIVNKHRLLTQNSHHYQCVYKMRITEASRKLYLSMFLYYPKCI